MKATARGSTIGDAALAGVVRGGVMALTLAAAFGLYAAASSVVEHVRRMPAMQEVRDGAHIRGRLDELAAFVADATGRDAPHRYAEGSIARGEWSPLPLSVTERAEGRVLTVGTVGDRVCAALELPEGAAAVSVNGGPFSAVPDAGACVPDRRHAFLDRRSSSGDRAVHEKRNVVAYLLAP